MLVVERMLCGFGWDWRDNEDFWVAMSSGRLADWIIEIAVYIHDAIGRGAPFENLQPPEFMDNSKGAHLRYTGSCLRIRLGNEL